MSVAATDDGTKEQNNVLSKYVSLGKLGEGTYGVVYKARHKENQKIVALKKVRLLCVTLIYFCDGNEQMLCLTVACIWFMASLSGD